MKIAVIGAGGAGLASLRHSLDEGHDCVGFEQTGNVGGTWNYTEEVGVDEYGVPVHSSMYKGLSTNLPKELMQYEDFPYKGLIKSYIPQEEVITYINNYATAFNLLAHIKFFTHVLQVDPLPDGKWTIKVKDLQTNNIQQNEYDAVFICVGKSVPKSPTIEGMDRFKGTIMHSHLFREPDPFKNRNVLFVGAGPSGIDISNIVSKVANKVVISIRSKNNIIKFPDTVTVKPEIKEFDEDSVIFEDNSMEYIDDIIFCTDCYERMAIGQRLNSKNVYKSFDYNTVTDCQTSCTKEKNACKAFSFGIGTKGNATCELSSDPVKETADLKPIGTIADTDYDLYIKKMGCSVVIDKSPHSKPPPEESGTSLKPGISSTYSSDPTPNQGLRPEYGDSKPDGNSQNEYQKPPYSSDYNNQHYLPPSRDDIQHVKTMVSVASGPRTFLHPIHDILIGVGPYAYGKPYKDTYYKPSGGCCEKPVGACCEKDDRPPFRPSVLNHPYDDDRPPYKPRPEQEYDAKPGNFEAPYGDKPFRKPYGPILRPDTDRYDDLKPIEGYGYDRPSKRPLPHGPIMRPNSDKYDDLKPYDGYEDDRPSKRPYGLVERPDSDRYDDLKPIEDYGEDRPSKRPHGPVERPDSDRYDDLKPIGGYGDDRPPKKPYGPDRRPGNDIYDNLKPNRPFPDSYDDRPQRPPFRPVPHDYDFKPNFDSYDRPLPHRYGSLIPHPDEYNKRPEGNDYFIPGNDRYDKRPPKRPYYDRPGLPEEDYASYYYDKPVKPFPDGQTYDSKKPTISKPYSDSTKPAADGGYDKNKPVKEKPGKPLDPNNPNGGYSYDKPEEGNQLSYDGEKGSGSKPIITQSVGSHGEQITSIITEIKEPCFRRVLAGKRVTRRCVKRSLTCETVEDCQRECADEQYFACEGFNYRIDPTGRGKGDCELLDIPLTQLDIGRDLYPDPDYDYYERDRNAASANCKPRLGSGNRWYGGGYGGSGGGGYNKYGESHGGGETYHSGGSNYYDYNRNGYGSDRRHYGTRLPDYKDLRRPGDRWSDDNRYDNVRPDLDRRYDYDSRKPIYDDYRSGGNRRGGKYLADSKIWDVLCIRFT